jgi:hypothetical protein
MYPLRTMYWRFNPQYGGVEVLGPGGRSLRVYLWEGLR